MSSIGKIIPQPAPSCLTSSAKANSFEGGQLRINFQPTLRGQHRVRVCDSAPLLNQLGQAKVRQMRLAPLLQQDVPRLDVPMQHPALMSVMDRTSAGGQHAGRRAWLVAAAVKPRANLLVRLRLSYVGCVRRTRCVNAAAASERASRKVAPSMSPMLK